MKLTGGAAPANSLASLSAGPASAHPFRFLSLFAGIGGFDLGLERAGWQCVGQVEIEPFCLAVLAKHWPHVPRWGDIRDATAESIRGRYGHIDAIVGGFPCQDISVAGKGAGIGGERSGLWYEMLRLIRELGPAWVVAENVPALRARGADRVLGDLEGAGYACWPLVVGADDVGAPHRRKRVWIVAYRGHRQPQESEGPDGLSGERTQDWRREQLDARAGTGSEPDSPPRATPTGDAEPSIASASSDAVANTERDAVREQQQRLPARRASGVRDEGQAESAFPGWPARPGERQYEWEESRLANAASARRESGECGASGPIRNDSGRSESERRSGSSEPRGSAGQPRQGTNQGSSEQSLGCTAARLPERLVRAANRSSLRAYGNAVVPQVAEQIGRAILAATAAPSATRPADEGTPSAAIDTAATPSTPTRTRTPAAAPGSGGGAPEED